MKCTIEIVTISLILLAGCAGPNQGAGGGARYPTPPSAVRELHVTDVNFQEFCNFGQTDEQIRQRFGEPVKRHANSQLGNLLALDYWINCFDGVYLARIVFEDHKYICAQITKANMNPNSAGAIVSLAAGPDAFHPDVNDRHVMGNFADLFTNDSSILWTWHQNNPDLKQGAFFKNDFLVFFSDFVQSKDIFPQERAWAPSKGPNQ